MAAPSRERLFFVTAAFLAEMRRSHAELFPGEDCPVRNLSDYSPEHRSALMAAVRKAIVLNEPEADRAFDLWKERRAAETDSSS